MSEESLLLVRSLKDRINRLFGEFGKVEQKNLDLMQEAEKLHQRIRQLEQHLTEVTQKYENLKLAKGFESVYGDNRMVRNRINKLVREIDKCVALLNE